MILNGYKSRLPSPLFLGFKIRSRTQFDDLRLLDHVFSPKFRGDDLMTGGSDLWVDKHSNHALAQNGVEIGR